MLELRALHRLHLGPIDLRIGAGECVSVMGASGAGKSVLLRMVADLDPHAGDALLDGRACSAMPAPEWRRQVTYVPAESGWWAETVAEHFAPGVDLAALLPRLGLAADLAQAPVMRCSTGERQRLALLRALQPGNRVLLLDEPTSGLDAQARAQVEALLCERLHAGGALLLVTHDAAQAQRMADRRLVMQQGQLHMQARTGAGAAA
ncbi:MAG: ATP-binding cassette domain-containing protein [Pseudomonadota bacterium]|nr:ATP-binding cassette domain-containing protein [Pseudomonadota bacterium]